MDNQNKDRRYLNSKFYLNHLQKIDKTSVTEFKRAKKISSLKETSNSCLRIKQQIQVQGHSKKIEKPKLTNTIIPKISNKKCISQSPSQDCLESPPTYWKKLEESEFREIKKTILKKDPSSFMIRSLYLPNSIKKISSLNNRSQCQRYKRFLSSLEADPYQSASLFSNTKLISFYDILDIRYENPTFYPYFNKNNKEQCRDTIVVPAKFPNYLPSSEETFSLKQKTSPKIEKSLRPIPGLSLLFFSPRKVTCPNNMIIINYESVNTKNSVIIREGIIEFLQMIQSSFHIVIITSDFLDRFEDIKDDLEIDGIKVSAIFGVNTQLNKNWKILDFSDIFETFNVTCPAKSCLYFSSHFVCEGSDPADYISSDFGSVVKINCEKVPICKSEYDSLPTCVLLPSQKSQLKPDLFEKIVVFLLEYLSQFSCIRSNINFEKILRESKLNFIESNIPGNLVKKYVEGSAKFSYTFNIKSKNTFIIQ